MSRSLLNLAASLAWLAAVAIALSPAIVGADMGGILPWTRWAVGIAAAVAMVLSLPEIWLNRTISWRSSSITLGAMAFALIGLIQCWSMPEAVGRAVAARSWDIYQATEQVIALSASNDLNAISVRPSISLSRWLTLNATAFMVVLGVIAFLSSQLFVSRSRICCLLVCFAITGAMHAIFGMYQVVSDPQANVWGIINIYGGQPFGAFFNRNNAGAMLNLGLAASVGLIAWRLAAITGAMLFDGESTFAASDWLDTLFDRVAMIGVITSLITLGGLFACGSRGAIAGCIAGLLLAFGVVQSLHRGRGLIPALLAAAVIAGVLLVQFDVPTRSIDRINEAQEIVTNDGSLLDGRIDHWKDAWRAALTQPLLGWGLRDYRYAYLRFQETSSGSWYLNADNLWLEWFVEMGLVGIIVALVLLVVIVRSLSLLNASADPIDHGLASTGWFAFGSMAVSQAFDFGCTIPANAMMLVILASAIVGRAATVTVVPPRADRSLSPQAPGANARRKNRGQMSPYPLREDEKTWPKGRFPEDESVMGGGTRLSRWKPRWLPPVSLVLLPVLLGVGLAYAAPLLRTEAQSDKLKREARILAEEAAFDEATARNLADSLALQAEVAPADSLLLLAQSRLATDLARYQAAIKTAGAAENKSQQWMANYEALSPRALRSVWYDDPAALKETTTTLLPFDGQTTSSTAERPPVADEKTVDPDQVKLGTDFHQARKLALQALAVNPNDDEVIRAVVSLDFAGGTQSQSRELIASLMELRIRRGRSLLSVGRLAAQARVWDLAAEAWTRAMRLQPELTQAVIKDFPADCTTAILDVFPEDAQVMAIAANHELAKLKPNTQVLIRAAQVIQGAISSEPEQRLTQLVLLARIHEKRGQFNLAAGSLAKAIGLAPADRDTRYFYCVMLRASGNLVEARQQARIGRQLAPADTRFEKIIAAMAEIDAR